MSTQNPTETDSDQQRLHYQRALAQTVTDEQFSAGGIEELTKTLSEDEHYPAQKDESLEKLLLETLDDSELGEKFVDFYNKNDALFARDEDTSDEVWDGDGQHALLSTTEAADRMDASGVPGRYQIDQLVGRGATGQVFAVKDNNLDRTIAVKFMHPKDITHVEKNERFIEEACTTARLDHPNILPLHDLDYTDGAVPFFSMRLADGQTLEQAIEKPGTFKGTPLEIIFKKIEIIIKVCDAINYAHSKGITHNDIKPGNIMVGEYGDVLVLDWGTSTSREQRSDPKQKILGTPMYMAPEQARKECSDELSDIYCIGTTLMHLLLRRFPIYSDDADTFWKLKCEGWYQALSSEERHLLPPRLSAVLENCLHKDRDKRYQSIDALIADLRCILNGEPVSVYQDPISDQIVRIVKKNKQALAVIAVFLLCLAGIGFLIYQEKLKELSEWKPIYDSHFENVSRNQFASDWKQIVFPSWNPNSIAEEDLFNSNFFQLKDKHLVVDAENYSGVLNLVSNIRSAGNLKVTWQVTTGEKPSDLNMFIGGNHRYNAYLFHIGGFGRLDQIRLTKYASVQTLDIHNLENPIQEFTTYHFTAIKSGSQVQLFMDGDLVIDYIDPIPYVGPQHEQFGFEFSRGRTYYMSSIQAWNQPLPQKISPIIIADDYFSHGHFQLALETYDDIRDNYSDISLAAPALFRSAQCLIELKNNNDARIRLREFLKRFPNHEYCIHAYITIGFTYLEENNWSALKETLKSMPNEFRGRPELRWLHQRTSSELGTRYQLVDPKGQFIDRVDYLDQVRKEASEIDRLFGKSADPVHLRIHQQLMQILENNGMYQQIIDWYGDSPISTRAHLFMGNLDKATALNPKGPKVIAAHIYSGNFEYALQFVNDKYLPWPQVYDKDTELRDRILSILPENHRLHEQVNQPQRTSEEILAERPHDFNALVSLRRYDEALAVWKSNKDTGIYTWQKGQFLSLIGREDETINSDAYSTITKSKAYTSKALRLWFDGKHEAAYKVFDDLQEYRKAVPSDLLSFYIYPIFLRWHEHGDKTKLRQEFDQLAKQFEGRYCNKQRDLLSWLLGDIDDETYLSKPYFKFVRKEIQDEFYAMRADLAGDKEQALQLYKSFSYTYDSDKQLFVQWRIRDLEQALND